VLALSGAGAFAVPAGAWEEGHGTRYTLEVSEGETTEPEWVNPSYTSASVSSGGDVAISIVRGGTTVYRNVGEGGHAWLSQVPQANDVVTLEAPIGNVVGSVTYDGLPTINPTVCAGSSEFSGSNTSGYVVEGFDLTYGVKHDPYGKAIGSTQSGFANAQVKSLTGTTFGGDFLTPLAYGETVGAVESLKTPLAGGATFIYASEFQRPVGACPPPPPPPPGPPALSGSIFKISAVTLRKLLRFGWSDEVSINQPGVVTQDVYLDSGKVPAYAASKKKRRHSRPVPPALLLARGATAAGNGGTVKVSLKLTAAGRRKLKATHHAKVIVLTTLTTQTGQKLTLGSRTLILHL
jgi:hypothetical protein